MTTRSFSIPELAAAQAQKHVTVNEALRVIDAAMNLVVASRAVTDPPIEPGEGEKYIPANPATGIWSSHENEIAAFVNGQWRFFSPEVGWRAFDQATAKLAIWDGADWTDFAGGGTQPLLGINTVADATNRLAVKSDAVLFSHDDVTPGTGDMRFVINKAAVGNTASLLFQTGYSGRGEVGLAGSDALELKASADGATFDDVLTLDPVSHTLRFTLDGSERARVSAEGYFGIGTSSPLERLHVNGTARMSEIWTEQGIAIGGDNTPADFWGSGGNAALFFNKGFLGTNGSFATSLFSNGHRNNAGSFTFLGVAGITDTASGIDLYPDGAIWFRGGAAVGTTILPRMIIDASGNVGIATTSPSDTLSVNGTVGISGGTTNIVLSLESTDGRCGLALSDVSTTGPFQVLIEALGDDMILSAGGAARLTLGSNGSLTAGGVYTMTTASAANVNVASDGLLRRSTSSAKYKDDIREMTAPERDVLKALRPVSYLSTCEGDDPKRRHFGLIAEEVFEAAPSLVHLGADGSPEGVMYDRIVPHLIAGQQTHETSIAELRGRVEALEAA
ncbi:DUF2793 domain-containing protein [Stappia sp. GBMRC 2046]|uniref:DUF2793 domain-containing protein n=1 Tax=Stappia sediminis TaxID=2692190 RepID=A0A7X3LY42_9HYPH|nr:DUF2793 domain-containing protein [Stappia sediminis]MXN67210.1 DUF2793 domain-containing protein [Stappia sediminis]